MGTPGPFRGGLNRSTRRLLIADENVPRAGGVVKRRGWKHEGARQKPADDHDDSTRPRQIALEGLQRSSGAAEPQRTRFLGAEIRQAPDHDLLRLGRAGAVNRLGQV
jgi:hypothetical protein